MFYGVSADFTQASDFTNPLVNSVPSRVTALPICVRLQEEIVTFLF